MATVSFRVPEVMKDRMEEHDEIDETEVSNENTAELVRAFRDER